MAEKLDLWNFSIKYNEYNPSDSGHDAHRKQQAAKMEAWAAYQETGEVPWEATVPTEEVTTPAAETTPPAQTEEEIALCGGGAGTGSMPPLPTLTPPELAPAPEVTPAPTFEAPEVPAIPEVTPCSYYSTDRGSTCTGI